LYSSKFTRKLNLFLAGPRAAEAALGTQYHGEIALVVKKFQNLKEKNPIAREILGK